MIKKSKQKSGVNWLRMGGFFGLGMGVGLVMLVGVARITWHSKFYPGVRVAGVGLAGLSREQGRVKLTQAIDNYQTKLVFNGGSWETPPGMVKFEVEATLNEAYRYGRRLELQDYLLLLINRKTDFHLKLAEGRTERYEGLITEIAGSVEIDPVEPTIEIEGNEIKIANGNDGILLSGQELDKRVAEKYSVLSKEYIEVPTVVAKRRLGGEQLDLILTRAKTLLSRSLLLTLDDERITLTSKELIALLATDGGEGVLDKVATDEYVLGLGQTLNKPPQDAKFEFGDGKVKEFAPGKDGVEVSIEYVVYGIEEGVEKLLDGENKSETVEIAVTRTPPKVTTDKVNELGIRERIGRGESYYAHSIPNRIYNVTLASTRLNSALVPPGEEISFNKLVGEVSGATGYRPAYIILGGRTVLGDGGGLCQVSTTMFRAAMAAGLPILERWGHAYRVSYYELNSKPGVDATVIAPSKDFRFKNDTPGHILIQTINDPKKMFLVIEIYGTSDGRVATISEPKVWGNSPPLPTIYQDDPTLPAGTMKQVDWSAPGAKASFEYKVVRNGETIQDKTFTTAYRPWAAVYLRGTGI